MANSGIDTSYALKRLQQMDVERKARFAEADKSNGNKLPFYSFRKPGAHRVRIGPPWKPVEARTEEWKQNTTCGLAVVLHRHKNIPKLDTSPVCVRLTYPQRNLTCPFCELVEDAARAGVPFITGNMPHRIQSRAHTNLLIRPDAPDLKGEGSELFSTEAWAIGGFPISVFKDLLSFLNDPEIGDFTNPENGRDITVERADTNGPDMYKTRYSPRESVLHSDPDVAGKLLHPRAKKPEAGVIETGMYDIDLIFGMSEAKLTAGKEQAEKIRAVLKIARGSVGGSSRPLAPSPQSTPKPAVGSSAAVVAPPSSLVVPAAKQSEGVAQSLDLAQWVEVVPEGKKRVTVEGYGQKPPCFSGIEGKLYLNYTPLSQERQNVDAFKGDSNFFDVPKRGRLASGCLACSFDMDCRSITESKYGVPA